MAARVSRSVLPRRAPRTVPVRIALPVAIALLMLLPAGIAVGPTRSPDRPALLGAHVVVATSVPLDSRESSANASVDNRSWVNLTSVEPTSPGDLSQAASTWDPALGGLLLFGGANNGVGIDNGTWLNRNGTWIELHPAHSPPASVGASLAYDDRDGYAVLFGGALNTTPEFPSETWTFNGSDWTELSPAMSPGGRAFASMAYDSMDQEVVLFGGYAGGCPFNDTWTFSGGDWTQVPGNGPGGRNLGSLSYDSQEGGAILFGGAGGCSGEPPTYSDTWRFASGSWTELFPDFSPAARAGMQQVEDPVTGGLLAYGGATSTGTFLSDTWEFTNGSWTNLSSQLAASPPPTLEGVLAANPDTGAVVLYGGFDVPSLTQPPGIPDDYTWALRPPITVSPLTVDSPSGSIDMGQNVTFDENASGGLGGLLFSWPTLFMARCPGAGTPPFDCDFTQSGTFVVQATVSDLYGTASGPSLSYTVAARPTVGAPTASRPSADVGQQVVFAISTSGGAGTLSIRWTGLPLGCPTTGVSVPCTIATDGSFTISANATDSAGVSAASPTLSYQVYDAPALGVPTVRTSSGTPTGAVDVGMIVVLSADLTGPGSGGPYAYQWSTLPGGCASPDTENVTCALTSAGASSATVSVTDSNGDTVTSSPVVWITNAALSIAPAVSPGSPTAGVAATLEAGIEGGSAPFTVTWAFPNASSATGPQVSHDFPSAGTETVGVRVIDAAGASRDANLTVVVVPGSSSSSSTSATAGLYEGLAIGLAIVVLVLLGALVLVMRRRGGSEGAKASNPSASPTAPPPPPSGPSGPSG
ncbi:MAG: PKD domain-containing protein [Thermoplasmata archaeon]